MKQTKKIYSKKLSSALKAFTQTMYEELAEKEDEGWTGWDDRDECTDANLVARAKVNLRKFARDKTNEFPEHGIDAANLVMFVWYRRKKYAEMLSR